ncbi:MAG TPA: tetratricopeptide repeat protein [Thermoanaerobaculia bacterium]|nr:tetratricopeptide repeat protein [Thermoanaerobaculia bacterium]
MSLERIEITSFAVIVGDILQNRRTGYLTIIQPPVRKVLYWSQGELVLITSASPEDSLADFLVRRGIVPAERAAQLVTADPTDAVARFHEEGILELSWRQTLLREWVAAQFIPLFSLDEGTAAFTEDAALEPEKRVFLQSTAALVIDGVRSITNGLVLRRSLGDLKREIGPARNSRFSLDGIPLSEGERRIGAALHGPETIESFLKHFTADSVNAAKVVISMLALGVFTVVESRQEPVAAMSFDDMQRDLELLAAIGSNDQRSLRAVAMSRQLPSMDHYQVLDVPRAATRAQIMMQIDEQKKKFEAASYPPIVRNAVQAIDRRIEEAANILKDAGRRAAYDKLLQERGTSSGGDASIQQRLTQRSIADQNFNRAQELTIQGDYYGAIVLLKQAVEYTPDNAQAWFLLGTCQERNPKWLRDAAESLQRALSIDPNFIDAMIALGDLYKAQGLVSRAQSCYEDVLKISAENQQAKSRLQALKKR